MHVATDPEPWGGWPEPAARAAKYRNSAPVSVSVRVRICCTEPSETDEGSGRRAGHVRSVPAEVPGPAQTHGWWPRQRLCSPSVPRAQLCHQHTSLTLDHCRPLPGPTGCKGSEGRERGGAHARFPVGGPARQRASHTNSLAGPHPRPPPPCTLSG